MADDLMSAILVTCTRNGRAGYLPDPTGGYSLIEGTDEEDYFLDEEESVFQDSKWRTLKGRQVDEGLVGEGEPLCGPEAS